MVDTIILNLIKRNLKEMAIHWARKNGADEVWIQSLDKYNEFFIYEIIVMLYGEPK